MGVFEIGSEMQRLVRPRPLIVDLVGGLFGAGVAVALLIALF